MTSTGIPAFTHSLTGRSIDVLELSPDTEKKLHRLGISTLEQLAKLAVNRLGVREREAIEAMRIELAARLEPHTVWCFTTSEFGTHFIIRAEGLFFFGASALADDNTSWTCTYHRYAPQDSIGSSNVQLLFQKPSTATIAPTSEQSDGNNSPSLNVYQFEGLPEEQNGVVGNEPKTLTVESQKQPDAIHSQSTDDTSPLHILLEEALSTLNERDRHIIELRYGLRDGRAQTLEAVGLLFGCSRARIGQVEQKALKKIQASSAMHRIRAALSQLFTVLDEANGIAPLNYAAQKIGIVATQNEDSQLTEAWMRFLLDFSRSMGIPKGLALVALKNDDYANVFDALPDIGMTLHRILRKAPGPLSAEDVLNLLKADKRTRDTIVSFPKTILDACLTGLPEVVVDELGYYALAGRTFDAPARAPRRPTAKSPVQSTLEVVERPHSNTGKYSLLAKQEDCLVESTPTWERYDVWNHAIATYITAGIQRGSTVYLSIDDEVLGQIHRRLLTHEDQPPEEFLKAVKQRVVLGRRVELKRIRGRNRHGEPNGVAFLAAMVLAASRMAEDEEDEIASSNYFTRFCEVLDIDQDGGRPLGMRFGAEAEEPLWREWIVWLGEIGLISSARPGEGSTRYINYPISQTLLRRTDRDRLCRLFQESNWRENWEVDTLMREVRGETLYLTKHLRTLLDDETQRAQAVAEAIYEVYEAWGSGDTASQTGGHSRGYNLLADIWRSEDLLSGAVDYFLYPRSPRRQQFDAVIVDVDGQQHSLVAERPGRYMPLCPVNVQQLNQGARYPIMQPDELDALILPRRAFWVLSSDPNNPESGVYASWGTVPLGMPFIILCRRELISDLEKLRAERLIEWSGEPQTSSSFAEWVEVIDCMVISPIWDGVAIEHRDLHEALRPKERLSIGLSGGLRAPQGGWLASLGPQVTIFGFPREAELRVTRISDNQKIVEETRPTNQQYEIFWPTPGDYLIEAAAESRISQRLVKIVDWEGLEAAEAKNLEWLRVNNVRLCGALLNDEGIGD
jgi:hypothetical protein